VNAPNAPTIAFDLADFSDVFGAVDQRPFPIKKLSYVGSVLDVRARRISPRSKPSNQLVFCLRGVDLSVIVAERLDG